MLATSRAHLPFRAYDRYALRAQRSGGHQAPRSNYSITGVELAHHCEWKMASSSFARLAAIEHQYFDPHRHQPLASRQYLFEPLLVVGLDRLGANKPISWQMRESVFQMSSLRCQLHISASISGRLFISRAEIYLLQATIIINAKGSPSAFAMGTALGNKSRQTSRCRGV